jgi:subtilisin-like proprotein convertase family protein
MFWNQTCDFTSANNEYIAVPNNATLNITGSFSIETWICPVNSTTPSSQILIQKRAGAAAISGYTFLLNNGKVTIRTNATNRLVGKTVLANNQWTHIAGTYNSVSNTFTTYINGVIDTTVVIAAAAPVTNSDSVFIGYGKGVNNPYNGQMDELRIWNRALPASEIAQNMRTSLGSNTGVYSGMVLSLPFQYTESSFINDFNTIDYSGNTNNGVQRGVSGISQNNRPYTTISINECVVFDGSNDYMTGVDNPANSPTSEMTIEAWIFPRANTNSVIIHKGSENGTFTYFRLALLNGKLNGGINQNFGFSTSDTVPLNRWSHVAFTYRNTGDYSFYLNGVLIKNSNLNVGNINDAGDSLFIGGTPLLTNFNGYIDEVRITESVKTQAQINQQMYISVDDHNENPADDVVYNLDGMIRSSTGVGPFLKFRGDARFSNPGTLSNQPVSPINRADDINFQSSFYLKTSDMRIPSTGTSGLMTDDTLDIFLDEAINDINLYVGINHTFDADLEITLIAPNGDQVVVLDDNLMAGANDNVTTVFDNDADSSIVDGRYVSFAPVIKAKNNIDLPFLGDDTKGKWILRINDDASQDTGRLYVWGIQFNDQPARQRILKTNALIQGFYDIDLHQSVRDTIRYNFRNVATPNLIAETVKLYIPINGLSLINPNTLSDAVDYYIQLDHRNSLNTYSGVTVNFNPLTSQGTFLFNSFASQAYGNNQIQVDNTPNRFAIYSGDINKNGFIDLTDVIADYNDVTSFATGYVKSDVTGNNITDLTDLLLVYNNSVFFVSEILPPGGFPILTNNNIVADNILADPNLKSENSIQSEFTESYILKENSNK